MQSQVTMSCSNLKLYKTLEVKNVFKQEKIMLRLTFNHGLTLPAFEQPGPELHKAIVFLIT